MEHMSFLTQRKRAGEFAFVTGSTPVFSLVKLKFPNDSKNYF